MRDTAGKPTLHQATVPASSALVNFTLLGRYTVSCMVAQQLGKGIMSPDLLVVRRPLVRRQSRNALWNRGWDLL